MMARSGMLQCHIVVNVIEKEKENQNHQPSETTRVILIVNLIFTDNY